jgi:FlaA1/EpsC-like NDP-sugar epimerase
MTAANSGKTFLLTGAGGWVGSMLAKSLVASAPRILVPQDYAVRDLHQIHSELAAPPNHAPHAAILGEGSDRALLAELFETHRPRIICHAAAPKRLRLMETNPLTAIGNNAVGTTRLARAAIEHIAWKLILLSTDKVVNPQSAMGASKRVRELALERSSGACCEMCARTPSPRSLKPFAASYPNSSRVKTLLGFLNRSQAAAI